jgi:hypothetical protein
MKQVWTTDNRKMRLAISIRCKGNRKFRVYAEDTGKQNSKYADRDIKVKGARTIFFSLPVTPKTLTICCFDMGDPRRQDFEVIIVEKPLVTYNVWFGKETLDFLKLAIHFSQVCGFESAGKQGRIFQTADEYFKIKYYPVIIDFKTGRAMNTPARIGHTTGNIDISKIKFDKYTLAMRMIILLHEFSHVYKNPKIGLKIENEIGADINALYIYLGLGFSKVDALYVYANIFLKAQTKGNIERMRRITDYITRFEAGEFAQKYGT